MTTPEIIISTNFFLKVASIIIKFFMSTIGPNTKNANKELVAKVVRNEEAINASASEHKDRIKANAIITNDDEIFPCPIETSVDVLI